jgi:predicted  nucleic acid-binding Zn-ribbon protein
MLDPITVFALAANIVQFIEVGYKATNIIHQLWVESKTDENLEIETAIGDLQDICTKLTSPSQASTPPSEDDKKLRTIAQSCQKLSKELESVLQKLVVTSKTHDFRRRVEVMQKALKSMFEAKKISDLQRRLGIMREQLEVRMMYILT